MLRVIRWKVTHAATGDRYVLECAHDSETGLYSLAPVRLPSCPYPVGRGRGHITEEGLVCVTPGREPRNYSQARAIAMLFVDGFSEYRRTGVFPDDPTRAITRDL